MTLLTTSTLQTPNSKPKTWSTAPGIANFMIFFIKFPAKCTNITTETKMIIKETCLANGTLTKSSAKPFEKPFAIPTPKISAKIEAISYIKPFLKPLKPNQHKGISSYIWHTETRSPYTPQTGNEPAYLDTHNHTAYYFHYSKTEKTTLDYQFLSTIHTLADAYLIYADTCLLSPEELSRYNITFKKIPRDITKL